LRIKKIVGNCVHLKIGRYDRTGSALDDLIHTSTWRGGHPTTAGAAELYPCRGQIASFSVNKSMEMFVFFENSFVDLEEMLVLCVNSLPSYFDLVQCRTSKEGV
jgi:hypothetical protein